MRQRLLRAALLLACLVFPLSVAALDASSASADEAELRRLAVVWMQALEKKDAPTLENILARDYVLQMPGDARSDHVPRGEWLKNAIGMDWTRFRYENLEVRVNGDQAEVTSRLFFHVSPFPIEFDSGVVDTWARRDGRWQVTRRYLGQSNMQDRLQRIGGFVAALVLVALALAVSRLTRRFRTRPA
jgi:hypothetical protein